jgi:hypothetical protein
MSSYGKPPASRSPCCDESEKFFDLGHDFDAKFGARGADDTKSFVRSERQASSARERGFDEDDEEDDDEEDEDEEDEDKEDEDKEDEDKEDEDKEDEDKEDEDKEDKDKHVPPRLTRRLRYWLFCLGFSLLLYASTTLYDILSREAETSIRAHPEDALAAHIAPAFADMDILAELPRRYLPGAHHDHGRPGRLVIVGDVHGMLGSLEQLLAKLDFDRHRDHLVLAGDMLSKGPDSAGVVRLAMHLGASAVRGNHEDRVLAAHHAAQARSAAPHQPPLAAQSRDAALAAQLDAAQLAWLRSLPLILRVGPVSPLRRLLVVHAGLVPGLPLELQDPWFVLNMRSLDVRSWVPSARRARTSWSRAWDRWTAARPQSDRWTVVYGHDSRRGLQLGSWSRGLDTGCRKGGRLTALVFAAEQSTGEVGESLVTVKCTRHEHDQA